MATRPVTDTIRHSDGSVWVGASVTFRLWLPSYTGSAAYPTELVTVTTNASGLYAATLWCDEEGIAPTSYQVTYPDGATFFIDIPVGDGSTVQMSALRAAVPGIPAVNLQTLIDALTFLALQDTPNSYVGQGGKLVAVNPGATALEFIPTPITGAPTDAPYITQTPVAGLSAEQALSLLASGYLRNTTGTGILTVQGTPLPIGDLPVAASGVSNATQVPRADDSRLSNARTPTAHTHVEADTTSLMTDLAAKAPLVSPALSGTPTAPTATAGTNTTQLATTAFTAAAIAALVASSPATLDTLNEIAAALGNDPNFATTITTLIGTKLAQSANLSDLASAATARINLGLDGRTTFNNANYTALATDKYIAQVGTLTAPRTVTLPLANAVNAGQVMWLEDESNTVNATNTISLVRAGADTINGGTSFTLAQPFKMVRLVSDGTSKWFAELIFAPIVNDFTTSGSVVIPPNCTGVEIVAIGASGGGGAGRRGAAASLRTGGGGAASASSSTFIFSAADFPSPTLNVIIGAAGAGAPAITTDNTDGAAGSPGGTTTVTSGGVGFVYANGGAAGGGGNASGGGSAGGPSGQATYTGVGGGAGGSTGAAVAGVNGVNTGGGGGGGGGITGADVQSAGGLGGLGTISMGSAANPRGTAGTAGGGNGGNAGTPAPGGLGGGGGGGGGSNTAGPGGSGGNGIRGGGGGGGGASLNGNNSGPGGSGSNGWCRIIFW